jgi:O-glycosyl hydrolase
LPEPTVIPSEHFDAILYTGTGSEHEISLLNFQPDLAWIKERPNVSNHYLYDSVRGATKVVYSDGTYAEQTDAQSLKSFDSDGYTLGTNTGVNQSSTAYVAWNWKANGSGSSNTDGSITSTVSANVDAGFSIVSYTGNATAGATVGHGLSKSPEMIIAKNRDGTTNWSVYHQVIHSTRKDALALNTTDATVRLYLVE